MQCSALHDEVEVWPKVTVGAPYLRHAVADIAVESLVLVDAGLHDASQLAIPADLCCSGKRLAGGGQLHLPWGEEGLKCVMIETRKLRWSSFLSLQSGRFVISMWLKTPKPSRH